MEIGARVGADVPFCIVGGCALCEGIGDIITSINKLPPCYIVVVKPRASISTAELFSVYSSTKNSARPDTVGALDALKEGDLGGIARRVFNVLEEFAQKDKGHLGQEDQRQCLGSSMSGSGSAVFGIFDEIELAM